MSSFPVVARTPCRSRNSIRPAPHRQDKPPIVLEITRFQLIRSSIEACRRDARSALGPANISKRPGSRREIPSPVENARSSGLREKRKLPASPGASVIPAAPRSSRTGLATLATGSRMNRKAVSRPSRAPLFAMSTSTVIPSPGRATAGVTRRSRYSKRA